MHILTTLHIEFVARFRDINNTKIRPRDLFSRLVEYEFARKMISKACTESIAARPTIKQHYKKRHDQNGGNCFSCTKPDHIIRDCPTGGLGRKTGALAA